MDRDLYALLGGIAASGAKYKIEIVTVSGGYQANAHNAGGSTAWTKPTLVAEGADLAAVFRKASTKFAEKTKVGRDRTYTTPLPGGPEASPFPKGVSVLPDHPLCWVTGRSLALLPADLRHRAILAAGQAADATPPPAGAAGVPTGPALGRLVMLCETIPNYEALDVLLDDDGWIMTEKMEGDRAQLHHDLDGVIYQTNRSGEIVNCPSHLVAGMRAQTPRGTSLDGEVITVDPEGRAQLYVGAKADIQVFVAFDLLAHPAFPEGAQRQPQRVRLERLAGMLPAFLHLLNRYGPPIRMVPWARGRLDKARLLAAITARDGEGVVMRDATAAYAGVRSRAWMRYRNRLHELDGVVISYREGTGKFAGTVGAVEIGLYDGHALRSIGWCGSGWSDAQRAALLAEWQAGRNGFVVTAQSFGVSFADQMIRPSGVRIRAPGDKQPWECRFESELGRPAGRYRG